MDFLELAKKRYSVRSFDQRQIEKEKMDAILEAGNIAPTAKNNQPQRIYVIKSEEGLQKVRWLTKSHYGAPTVLLFAYNKGEEFHSPLEPGYHSGPQDVSIVATHIMLKAAELGIGSVWVNMFAPREASLAFGLPDSEVPVLLMPIGYPAEGASPSPRHSEKKPLSETVKEI